MSSPLLDAREPKYSLLSLTGSSDNLLYRLHVLLFDLQNFTKREDCRKRLDTIADISYIEPPYFTGSEAEETKEEIKNATKGSKTLSEIVADELSTRLERRTKKRVESGDYRICAAHDLSPILARTLNIDLKQLEKDKEFLRLVGTKGLHLDGETWKGLKAKSFAPRNKYRRKG
ncbi:hypothetical protein BDV59DRAFT_206510 [Aspergillus ambiguus]|uniref:uncharacterized protein n=1 Tax=Aspergillus ambiguus TaxID=176160 RepID=UPI003CCDC910